jgi:hypothetical protein
VPIPPYPDKLALPGKNDGGTPTHPLANDPSLRAFLLAEVLNFVSLARFCPGVSRIALIGSLTTSKPQPKDADVLVSVADDADLTTLAKAGRRLMGRAQSKNSGADIFLANPEGKYIGRICHWRECRPFLRLACDARHCGRREFLHDDLDAVTLEAKLVKEPPVELWPNVVRRIKVPEDVESQLLRPLDAAEIQK